MPRMMGRLAPAPKPGAKEAAPSSGTPRFDIGAIDIAAGRISTINGLIDKDVADIQWAQNTRARADSGGHLAATPPLAGALLYISQTRDVVIGGSAPSVLRHLSSAISENSADGFASAHSPSRNRC